MTSPFAGIFIAEQARALALNYKVRVLAPEILPAGSNQQRRIEIIDGYTVVRVGIPARSLIHHLGYARAVIREIKASDCDLVHAHVSLPAGFASVLACQWTRHPVVITEHRGPFSALMETSRDRFKVRFALERADAAIAVSRALAEQIKAYGITRQIEIVPNLVDTEKFKMAPSTRQPGTPFRLLFAGVLRDHNKNLPLLLRALARLQRDGSEYWLTIVGDGEVRVECEEIARELGIDKECRFLGALNPDGLAREMRNCDLFVLPSRAETFGVVVAEAMAVGRPVIATRSGGPEDIVTPETGCLVPVDDEIALAEAIAYVSSHLDCYQPEAIAAFAHSRFSYKAVVEQLAMIYDSIL